MSLLPSRGTVASQPRRFAMRAPLLIVLLAVLAAGGALIAILLLVGGGKTTASTTELKVGTLAPDFELLEVTTSRPVTLSSLRGRPVWLNFWATWCPPCKVEQPLMK